MSGRRLHLVVERYPGDVLSQHLIDLDGKFTGFSLVGDEDDWTLRIRATILRPEDPDPEHLFTVSEWHEWVTSDERRALQVMGLCFRWPLWGWRLPSQ